MIGHLADGLVTAGSRTWVYTAQIHTCLVLSAFGTNRALGTTGGWGTNIVGNARADRMTIHLTALAIRTTRRRSTWLHRWRQFGYFAAILRGVARETRGTTATGCVVDHMTLGSDAADSWAGISALVVEAGAILGTVAVEHALWAAFRVRIATVFGKTGAGTDAVSFLTYGIGATGTGVTGLCDFRRHNNLWTTL